MIRLDWDSEFWGVDIFNIDESDIFYKSGVIDEIIKNKDNYVIQALISDYKVKQIQQMEEGGFRFVESKITLKKSINQTIYIDFCNFKKIEEKEIRSYKDVFFDLYGKVSRYSLFPNEKINYFYYTWVVNSIYGKMDDECIGYYIDNQLAGFATYRYRDGETIIGLIGVFPDFQNKGISQKILYYINNDAIEKGHKIVSISTQGINSKAINAYIKNGFYFDSIKYWFYMNGGTI